ncbi:type III polyketide synthase [Luedemannella helvata]|uniref:Type III polyketide synthase n=1 Tax=Luedemannella helvata TaxID=349315 RepID=A0ABP4WIC7_9ACTN
MVSARIAGIGVAHPPPVTQGAVFDGFFAGHYAGVARGLAKRVFENSGVVTRHGVANPLVEDVSQWPTSRRMERYLAEALPLGKEAVSAALAEAGLAASDIGLLAVCSCTGYVTPGLDILLARDLGLPATAQRLFVGHMGCYAALPGLGAVSDFVSVRRRPAVLLCVELPSLHVQPAAVDPQQVVAHALFSDAAAAAVVLPTEGTYGVREVASVTDTTTADYMTWQVTDLGFRMGLSPQVPDALRAHVRPLVAGVLAGHGLSVGDVGGWAVHPGGPRILDVVGEELGLSEDDLAASRGVLADHGNCSSPTVLMIADRLRDRGPAPIMMLAFGPGLTLYSALIA